MRRPFIVDRTEPHGPEHALGMMLALLDGLGPLVETHKRARLGLDYLDHLGFVLSPARMRTTLLDRSPASIRRAREKLQVSRPQLAQAAGLSAATILKIERGHIAKDATVERIISALVRLGAVEGAGTAKELDAP